MAHSNTTKGISILGIIFWGFLLLLLLSYFNISVKSVVESPTGQENLNYVGGTSRSVWNDYLRAPAYYLWHDIWIELFWKSFISNMQRIRDGKPTDFDEASKNLQVTPSGQQ